MSQRSSWRTGIVVALAITAVACKGGEQAKTTPAGGAGTVSGEGTPSPASSTATTQTTTGVNLTDPNVVAVVDELNTAEIDLGKLAESKATSAQVKSFARLMVAEHTGLRDDVRKTAQRLNLTPQAPPNDTLPAQSRAITDSLRSMPKGAKWDRAYIDHEVSEHQAAIQEVQSLIGQVTIPTLKGAIQNAVPVLQKHLDRAKAVQKALGG